MGMALSKHNIFDNKVFGNTPNIGVDVSKIKRQLFTEAEVKACIKMA